MATPSIGVGAARRARAVVWLLAVGCGSSLGEPTTQPAPTPDGRPALITPGARSSRIANYRIAATLSPETFRIEATETLTWRNTGALPVRSLPFHLYMNAFKNEGTVFMRASRGQHRGQAASDKGWGWIDVSSIRIGGVELRSRAVFPDLAEGDETVMRVPLDQPLAPGETIQIDFAFTVQLPEVFARTGYKGKFAMVGQWFPKIGVRTAAGGAERWHCEPFHLNSEFFADFGTYDVTLTVPDTHVVAATGVLTAVSDAGGKRTLTYRAEDVHDFAWMADPYMKVMTGTANTARGPVEVRVYHRPMQRKFARRHLRAGIGAVEQFSALFVPYPWTIMSIIDPPLDAGGASGMEYPTLVTTAGDMFLAPEGVRVPEFVTVHEVGHNWFQGILASNEVEEAWLDEGVNEYADVLVMQALYGDATMLDWHGLTLGGSQPHQLSFPRTTWLPSAVATRAPDFSDNGTYGAATYAKTAMALRMLERLTDPVAFRRGFRRYAETFAFKHPTGRDLFRVLASELGQDVSRISDPAFYGRGGADLRVRSMRCWHPHPARGVHGTGDARNTVSAADAVAEDGFECEVLLVNRGVFLPPVDVRLRFEDGKESLHAWPRGRPWHRIRVSHLTRLESVLIDPAGKILLNDSFARRHVRMEGATAASRRAASRMHHWTQTLMQGAGL